GNRAASSAGERGVNPPCDSATVSSLLAVVASGWGASMGGCLEVPGFQVDQRRDTRFYSIRPTRRVGASVRSSYHCLCQRLIDTSASRRSVRGDATPPASRRVPARVSLLNGGHHVRSEVIAMAKLTHDEAAKKLRDAGITWSSSGNCSDRNNKKCTS